ncbi:hypothetical protein GJ629_08240, partial [Halapricum sp. CBA1109]|uniref:universal stress protein n=1 Tax=Halapricum sp. CBA1109 TaxID=2668068 RepID=UPI0013BB1780
MNTHAAEGDVLVAVADPDHVQQLVRTASALTDGTVRLVTVVVKPHDSPFGLFSDDTIRRDFAGDSRDLLARADPPAGVSVERDLVVGRSVADGLLAAVAEYDSNALIVGWQGGSRTDSILGSTVDRLVEREQQQRRDRSARRPAVVGRVQPLHRDRGEPLGSR